MDRHCGRVAEADDRRLGEPPRAAVLALDRSHAQLSADLGAPVGRRTGETRAVMRLVRRVLAPERGAR